MKRFPLIALLATIMLLALSLAACGATSPALTTTASPSPAAPPVVTAAPTVPATEEPGPAPTPHSSPAPDLPFTLTSTAFVEGEAIPDRHTYRLSGQCDGANLSPELTWVGAPAGAQSFALTMDDPDGGDWVHWVQFNVPGDATSLPEAAAGPAIGVKGRNDFGELGYGGPCPPSGTHRYIFTLYALDTELSASEGAARSDIENAMAGHVLAQTQLTGLRSR